MSVSIYSRHHGLGTVEEGGRVSLEQRRVVLPQTYPDTLMHEIVAGETLDLLAARYYGREDLWWRIADANPGRFPLSWNPGDILEIPPLRVATRMPRR